MIVEGRGETMYIVVKWVCPHHLAEEFAKRVVEGMKEYPDDETIVRPMIDGAMTVKKDGFHVTGIAEIVNGKTKEIFDLVNKRNLFIIHGLEGIKYSVETAYSRDEALETFGLQI